MQVTSTVMGVPQLCSQNHADLAVPKNLKCPIKILSLKRIEADTDGNITSTNR